MSKTIDWSYHRKGWTSCNRAQEFLASNDISTAEQVDAKKQRLGETEALELLKGMEQMYVAKGKKVVEVDLKKDRPDDATLTKLMLGPTGNLRAPTMKVGKRLLIGFNNDTYTSVLQ